MVVENFHGVPYTKPLTRMRETVGILRALWRGDRLEPGMSTLFEPRHFKLEMTPYRADVPIYFASLQEKAIRDIGRVADGWVPTFWPYRHFKDGLAWIRAGAEQAGRDASAIELAPFVGVVPFDDLDMARGMIKPLVSFYIGGMGVYYHALFCRYGFEENANLVRDLYQSGKRKEAAAAVSDELVDAIAVCGPAGHCRDKLDEWRHEGVGAPLINLPTNLPADMVEQFLHAMAPGR
jgi:alkanesulfonate monooxygenase SsuD/methylene tetrahydromethanopterin reductase-like flavin-dependent oxidoreductase (luciferase family)